MKSRRLKAKHIPYVMLALLVGFVILLALSPITGLRFDVILSGSMSSSINVGDLVVVTHHSPDHLKVGDVIVFRSPISNGQICHRIISISQVDGSLVFQTQGDNNEDPDPFTLQSDNIIGKVQLCIPAMGYVVQWLRGPFGILAIIALGAATFLMPEKSKDEKKEKMKEDVNGGA
ncbi:MAG: signal peptidase I [Methanomassiliicoccales archaeon]|nr:signal peptidase I [Methanomassiliicoccales archaeon]